MAKETASFIGRRPTKLTVRSTGRWEEPADESDSSIGHSPVKVLFISSGLGGAWPVTMFPSAARSSEGALGLKDAGFRVSGSGLRSRVGGSGFGSRVRH